MLFDLRQAAKALEQVGIEDALREVRIILHELSSYSLSKQFACSKLDLKPEESILVQAALERRLKREPLSRILAYTEFFGQRFYLNEDCLAPRPDSEIVVELALELIPALDRGKEGLRLLDLCCGSGALGLSVLAKLRQRQQAASLHGVDLAAGALQMAERNAQLLQVAANCSWQQADVLTNLSFASEFDLVICNPPYIPSAELESLEPEVSLYEARLCLDGGSDGLVFYRQLAATARDYLRQGAYLVLEHGCGQRSALVACFAPWAKDGKVSCIFRDDLGSRDRAMALRKE